jgi:heme-degrading monooxygenase HmoA
MPALGQLFTSATWLVKEGKETNFIAAWKDFAEWTSRSGLSAGTGHLLQDSANSRSFLSFGPWGSLEEIQRWRNAPEFQAFLATARELCEQVQPRTLSLVALSPSSK